MTDVRLGPFLAHGMAPSFALTSKWGHPIFAGRAFNTRQSC